MALSISCTVADRYGPLPDGLWLCEIHASGISTKKGDKLKHFTGIHLSHVIGVNAIACAVCSYALPICVGPVDVSNAARQPSNAGVALEPATSPALTFAHAEVTPPMKGFPGCIVGEVSSHSDSVLHNVVMRYDVPKPIIINRSILGRRITVDGSTLVMKFPTLPPHATASVAIDFRYPGVPPSGSSAIEMFVPLRSGVLVGPD